MLVLLFWYFFLLKITMLTSSGMVDFTKPLPAWKRLLFVEAAQPLCRFMLMVLGFWNIKQSGPPSLFGPKGKANIIVMNHVAHFDILVMMALCHDGIPSFVAKRGVQSVPLFGYKSMVWQGLYVDNRSGNAPGGNLAQKIAERASNHDLNPILIFPEGTTTNGESLISFRSGAFISGAPVKPVTIRYPPGNFSPAWESIGALYHMFRVFSQWSNACEVEWLPVYYPNEQEKKDPKLYAENVRTAMANALHVPKIDASFQDKVDYHVTIGLAKPPKNTTETHIVDENGASRSPSPAPPQVQVEEKSKLPQPKSPQSKTKKKKVE